jgi:hypothetical protein
MLIATCYDPGDMLGNFLLGFILGFGFAFLLLIVGTWLSDKHDELKEFRAYKKNGKKAPETVDAQFVEVRPKELNQPSQALVRRNTNLTRR